MVTPSQHAATFISEILSSDARSLEQEFTTALLDLNFDKVAECLDKGVNPNALFECDVKFMRAALNNLINPENDKDKDFSIDFFFCYTASLVNQIPIYGDDTYFSTSAPHIQYLKFSIPPALIAVCYQQDQLVQSFLEKGAHTDSMVDLLKISHLEDYEIDDIIGGFREIWPGFIALVTGADQLHALQQIIDLGIFNPNELDLCFVIDEFVVEHGDVKFFEYLETLDNFKKLLKDKPTFLEEQAKRIVIFAENKAPALLNKFEKYLPDDFFMSRAQHLLHDSVFSNTKPELLQYLVSKGINLKDFKGDYWSNSFLIGISKFCENLDTIKYVISQGFDPAELNDKSENILFFSHPDYIEYWVDNWGIDINQVNIHGETPIWQRLLGEITSMKCDARIYKDAFSDPNLLAAIELFKKGTDINQVVDSQNMIQNLLDQAGWRDDGHYQLCVEIRLKTLMKMGLEPGELSEAQKESFDAYMVQDNKIDAFLAEFIDEKKPLDVPLNQTNKV